MATAHRWVRFVVNKGDAFRALVEWKKFVELQTGLKVCIIGLDGGPEFGLATTEFKNSKLDQWAKQEGVEIWKTTPHTPWMNGPAELTGRLIMTKTRTVIQENKIPIVLWPFVMDAAVRVMNLLPTKANKDNDKMSPHELLHTHANSPKDQKKPYIKHLRKYWCTAYYYIKPQKREQGDKFTPRARKAHLLNYGDEYGRIYWLYDPESHEIIRASAVKFVEKENEDKEREHEPQHTVVFEDHSV
jgi:hypothetical protein